MTEVKLRSGHASIQAGDLIGSALMQGLINAGPDIIFESCASCHYANTDGAFICTKFNIVPPVAVIIVGCSSYDDAQEIPF